MAPPQTPAPTTTTSYVPHKRDVISHYSFDNPTLVTFDETCNMVAAIGRPHVQRPAHRGELLGMIQKQSELRMDVIQVRRQLSDGVQHFRIAQQKTEFPARGAKGAHDQLHHFGIEAVKDDITVAIVIEQVDNTIYK